MTGFLIIFRASVAIRKKKYFVKYVHRYVGGDERIIAINEDILGAYPLQARCNHRIVLVPSFNSQEPTTLSIYINFSIALK